MTTELTPANYADYQALMSSSESSQGCMCTWWFQSVKDYHANGAAGNEQKFRAVMQDEALPMGILLYDGTEAVGWCACGPRRRYSRAIKTPTFQGRDPAEDGDVWFVPCFYVRQDYQKKGVSERLLAAALELAKAHGAKALEGFPFCTTHKVSSGDVQVGFETTFEKAGFARVRQNSNQRVVVRRNF